MNFVLSNTYFVYNDTIYKQIHGFAMGSPVSPVVANLQLWLHTPWDWNLPEGKWLGLGSAQVSCYPWGCGYTVKDIPQGKKYFDKQAGKVKINMDVTNRDLVSLISVIPLLIIRHSSINITVQQFFCEKTPNEALSTTPPSRFVGILFTVASSTTTELVSATSKEHCFYFEPCQHYTGHYRCC